MAKKGVLIGCNYPGTKAELRGCVNDVWRMHNCLINRYGFLEKDITVLIDTDRSYMLPTGKNIRMALSKLVRSARPGDVLFVHYSGHGTRLPAEAGEEDDDTGYDECIVPADMNLITDDDFRRLVDKIPSGCRITIVSDSCHSGGLIEAAKEQIGDSTKEGDQISGHGFRLNFLHRAMEEAAESHGIHIPSRLHCNEQENDKRRRHAELQHADYSNMKSRSLPLTTLIDMLKQKTGKDDIDVGKLRHTLFDIFRKDASPKVKKFMKFAFNKLRRGGGNSRGLGGVFSIMNSIADEILNQMLDEHDEGYTEPSMQLHAGTEQEAHAGSTKGRFIDCGILLSGCQTDQTSADACPSGNPEEAYGAFSNAIQAIIEETDGEITNSELVLKARRKLKWQGFSQRPGLYCSDQYVEAPFLC